MERGELPPDEKLAGDEGESGRVTATVDAVPIEGASDEGGSSDTKLVAAGQDEEEIKEENVPDGEEKELEWREGPHKVIERRAGPGEEVRRVARLTFKSCIDRVSQTG
jgi:hypothetical protein